MRAAVLRDRRVAVGTVDDPVPGPGQLLVRSLACGICASDLHFMDHPEAGADDDSEMSTYDTGVGIVMGHEFCAEVVGHGPGTERRFAPGTRVSSLPVLSTPNGRRVIGQNPDSPGGFGEYLLIDEARARVVDSRLPDRLVCVADAIAVGWSAARRAALATGEVPLVIGCGAIGLGTIAGLRSLGVGPIVAADPSAPRRATASAMGADVVLDPAHDLWAEITAGRGCVVFECVGVPGVLASIVAGCPRGTRIFSAGGPPEGERLPTLTAKRKGLNIQFGGGPLPQHWDEAFDAVCGGTVDVTPMVGHTVGLDGVPAALDEARDPAAPVRIVVVP